MHEPKGQNDKHKSSFTAVIELKCCTWVYLSLPLSLPVLLSLPLQPLWEAARWELLLLTLDGDESRATSLSRSSLDPTGGATCRRPLAERLSQEPPIHWHHTPDRDIRPTWSELWSAPRSDWKAPFYSLLFKMLFGVCRQGKWDTLDSVAQKQRNHTQNGRSVIKHVPKCLLIVSVCH